MLLQFVNNNIRIMITEDIVNARFDDSSLCYTEDDHQVLIDALANFCDGKSISISKYRYYTNNLVMCKTRDEMRELLKNTFGRGVIWAKWGLK